MQVAPCRHDTLRESLLINTLFARSIQILKVNDRVYNLGTAIGLRVYIALILFPNDARSSSAAYLIPHHHRLLTVSIEDASDPRYQAATASPPSAELESDGRLQTTSPTPPPHVQAAAVAL